MTTRTASFSTFDESPSSSSRNVLSIDASHASMSSDFKKSSISEVKEEEEEERHDAATTPKSTKKTKTQISWSGYNGNSSRRCSSESSASSKSKNSLHYIPHDSLLQVPDLMMNDDDKDEYTTSSSSSHTKRDPSSLSFSSTSASSASSSSSKRRSEFRYPSTLTGKNVDDIHTMIQQEIRLLDKIKNGHDSISSNPNKKSSITSTCSSACSSITMDPNLHSSIVSNASTSHDHYRTILTENELVATCQKSHGTCIMHVYDYDMDYSDLSCAIDKHLERMSAPLYPDRRLMTQKCEFVRVHSSLLSSELATKLGVTSPATSPSGSYMMAPTVLAIRNGVVEGQLSDIYPDLYKRNDGDNGATKNNFPSSEELEDGQFIKDFVLITGCTKSDSCNLRSLLNSFRFVSVTERGGGIL